MTTSVQTLARRISNDATASKSDRETLRKMLVEGTAAAIAHERAKGASDKQARRTVNVLRAAAAKTESATALLSAQLGTVSQPARESRDIAHLSGYGSSARLWQEQVRQAMADPTASGSLKWRRDADLQDGTAPLQTRGRHIEGSRRASVAVSGAAAAAPTLWAYVGERIHRPISRYTTRAQEVSVVSTRQWSRADAAAAVLTNMMQEPDNADLAERANEALPLFGKLDSPAKSTARAINAVARALGLDPSHPSLRNAADTLAEGIASPDRHAHFTGLVLPRESTHPEQQPIDPSLPGYPTSQELANTAPRPRPAKDSYRRATYSAPTKPVCHPEYATTCDPETADLFAQYTRATLTINPLPRATGDPTRKATAHNAKTGQRPILARTSDTLHDMGGRSLAQYADAYDEARVNLLQTRSAH